jgi:DNA (cytosine-5)-methyltransferase 1
MIVSHTTLGTNQGRKRLWMESPRLRNYGFDTATPLKIDFHNGGLRITPSPTPTKNKVSRRRISLRDCPIIDLSSQSHLKPLSDYEEIKIQASINQIIVTPTRRAFYIKKHKDLGVPFNTMEFFSGGGTISEAFHQEKRFNLVGACEVEPKYAHCFSTKYPDVPLYMTDIRSFDPAGLEPLAVVFGSLPCECFSSQGVTKNGLKGQNELGHTGDLFIPFLNTVTYHMPLAVVVENVPNFQTSLAGQLLATHLERLGYHVSQMILQPHDDWAEIQDRKRYVLFATRNAPFTPVVPHTPFSGTATEFLDAPDPEQDLLDVNRISKTVKGLQAHMDRHRAKGNGFGFTTINYASSKIPTIVRSYHKINNGPFVETPYGLRMLRQAEVERIMGCTVDTHHYATAIELLGQGTQTRIFAQLFKQLADFLCKQHLSL